MGRQDRRDQGHERLRARQSSWLQPVSEVDLARLDDVGVDREKHVALLGKDLEPPGAGLRSVLVDVDHPAARHPLGHT